MDLNQNNFPGFFKIFMPQICAEHMVIPASFIRCVRGQLPNRVMLRDQINNIWQVKVVNVDDKTYFQDGWTTFTEDTSVQSGDLMCFDYFCEGCFNVNIFDRSRREKEGVQQFIFKGIKWQNNIYEKNGNQNEEEEEKQEEEDTKRVGEDEVEVGIEIDEEDEEGDEEIEEETFEAAPDDSVDEGLVGHNLRPKKRILDIYGGDLFRSGIAVQPNNPYFLTKVSSRKYELYIPMEIVDHCNIKYEDVTYLRDPMGKEWKLKYQKWKDGRVVYSRGWRKFCKNNHVDKDDICICEFIEENQGPYIKVTIVRANQGHL